MNDINKMSFDFSSRSFAEAKEKMCKFKSNQSIMDFYKIFARLVEYGEWVYAPCYDTKGLKIRTVSIRGGAFIPIYSKKENYRASKSKLLWATDINKFIDILYENPRIQGIVIDPDNEPFFMTRRAIHAITIRKDYRLEIKDWGRGIPVYTEKDLMVAEELLDFGMQIVEKYYIKKNGFTIVESNFDYAGCFNFAIKKSGQLFFLVVRVEVGDKPICSEQEKNCFVSYSNRFNAKCLFAPIEIISDDKQRAKQKLALYGDGYNVIFDGVIALN